VEAVNEDSNTSMDLDGQFTVLNSTGIKLNFIQTANTLTITVVN